MQDKSINKINSFVDVKKYSGYNKSQEPKIDDLLALVGPGTPCGEYFRRYWHPIALSSEINKDPKEIKILGENLVLFKTISGKIGLVHKHCPHRNASLVFGKCESCIVLFLAIFDHFALIKYGISF